MTTLKPEQHEEMLTELLGGELEESRKAEIVLSLREDRASFEKTSSEIQSNIEKLKSKNESLIEANVNYFNKLSAQERDFDGYKEKQKEEKKKTVTLSDLLAGK